MVQIKNLQTLKKINRNKFRTLIISVLRLLELEKRDVSFVFCDNTFIRKLNYRYFKKRTPTDVISFNLEDAYAQGLLGEVIISVEEALKNSVRFNTGLQYELTLYVVHGILHLIGYTDYTRPKKEAMERKQSRIMKALSIRARKG